MAESSGDERLRIETLAFIGRRHVSLGNLSEARQIIDESVRIARKLDHKPALIAGVTWRGMLHFFQSEYERAEEMLTEGLRLSSEQRDGFIVLFCLYFLGLTRGDLGRMSDALDTLDEAMELSRRNGDRNQSLKIPNAVGWIYRELGDFDQALRADREGVEVARKHHLLEAEINSVINLGHDYTARGEGEKAPPAFREVDAMLERDDWFRWRFNLRLQSARCEHLLSQGALDEAEVRPAAARTLHSLRGAKIRRRRAQAAGRSGVDARRYATSGNRAEDRDRSTANISLAADRLENPRRARAPAREDGPNPGGARGLYASRDDHRDDVRKRQR